MSKQNNVYTFLVYIHLPDGISCYPLFDNVFTSYISYNRVSLYSAVTVVNNHSLIILGNHIAPNLEREIERGGENYVQWRHSSVQHVPWCFSFVHHYFSSRNVYTRQVLYFISAEFQQFWLYLTAVVVDHRDRPPTHGDDVLHIRVRDTVTVLQTKGLQIGGEVSGAVREI